MSKSSIESISTTNGKPAQIGIETDPFDLDRLRLSQNFGEALGVKRF